MDIQPLSYLIQLEKSLQLKYDQILCREKMLWFQKYRNKNTKFFHTHAIVRRRHNKATGLFIDGVWYKDVNLAKKEALNFYMKLFQSIVQCILSCANVSHVPKFDDTVQKSLMAPISLKEVKDTLFAMNPFKGPSLTVSSQSSLEPIGIISSKTSRTWYLISSL